jgi:pectin methylesterase-like acyl-CoA thioesterase
MILASNLKVTDAAASKTLEFVPAAPTGPIPYASVITVGTDKEYKTINAALADITRMTRTATERVTVMIDPGNYEEMLVISKPNITLKNASPDPSIALSNKGVDIDLNKGVRITSYYGHAYSYYSMKDNQKWDADVLRANKLNEYHSYTNAGAGTTNGSYWNATVVVNANGFQADDIIFENSYNQYISLKESQDVLVPIPGNNLTRSKIPGNTSVQDKIHVERAAAIAIANNIDKVLLNKCRVVGRQDSFFGGTGSRVAVYKGVMMGGTDYIFGGMNAVFYQSDLAMWEEDI